MNVMKMKGVFALLLPLTLSLMTVTAQSDCPAFVRTALETANAACQATGRGLLCYGHPALTLTSSSRAAQQDLKFEQPGDLISVNDVQQLQLGPVSLEDAAWGIALMKVQANLPASQPESSVTYLLFGEGKLENSGTTLPLEAKIVAPGTVNIRSAPSSQAAPVMMLDPGTLLTVNGRNAAGDWLHLQLEGGEEGWIAAFLVHSESDLTTLSTMDAATPAYAPMQAFMLQTGTREPGCADLPVSGLLIQTPEAAGAIRLQVNTVNLQLNGTAFLRAAAGDTLRVDVLAGSATLSAGGKSIIVPAGASSLTPLDAALLPTASPAAPIPYSLEELQSLPLNLLPLPVDLIEPLSPREIVRLAGCQLVSTVKGINFREGPAVAYFAHRTLIPNTSYRITGQAVGKDGYTWWQTGPERWVRGDVVTVSGNCDDVPVIDARPAQPSTAGRSTDLTCQSERVIYASVGDLITITESYASSAVPVSAITGTISVDGAVIYEGNGSASGSGITWTATWVATSGIHNVELRYTPTIEIKPDWADKPFAPGEYWSHGVCQVRVQ